MGVKWKMNRLPELAAKLPKTGDEVARALGFAIMAEAQLNIRRMQAIDTGALFNSGYVETSKGGARDAAVRRAVGKSKQIEIAVPRSRIVEQGSVKVAFAVAHATIVHMGVSTPWAHAIGARPFLSQAVETIGTRAGAIAGDIVTEGLS